MAAGELGDTCGLEEEMGCAQCLGGGEWPPEDVV